MVVQGETGSGPTVSGHKLSSVVPAMVTGEVTHELTNMDLAMKLHYLRGVHYFRKTAALTAQTITSFKGPMFPWLDMYFPVSGRVRKPEDAAGRPFVKCNDCGVRIIEAKCDATLDEWLNDKGLLSRTKLLVSNKVLGPELYFSPLIYIQFTYFKCGGLAIGYSWAHLIGDPLTATTCFNMWAQLLSGTKHSEITNPLNTIQTPPVSEKRTSSPVPHSAKVIESVGDHWIYPGSSKMETFSFQITESKLKQLQIKDSAIGDFELISALLWQTLAKVRGRKELKTVTVCKNSHSRSNKSLTNEQRIMRVTIEYSPAKAEISELAMAIVEQSIDETELVQGLVQGENGIQDVLVYGANLTFVDMQELDLYGLEIKGEKAVSVEYAIDGVGEEGAILVQKGNENRGKLVVLILQEDEIQKVRESLKSEWGLA